DEDEGLKEFKQGVSLFASDLEVMDLRVAEPDDTDTSAEIEARMLKNAADPPRVLVERDEGQYYLYLGAKPEVDAGKTVRIVRAAISKRSSRHCWTLARNSLRSCWLRIRARSSRRTRPSG